MSKKISIQEVVTYLNKFNIEYENRFNKYTFKLENKSYEHDNEIYLFIFGDQLKIIIHSDKVERQENFSVLDNLYEKYNFFKKISKYYNKNKVTN